MLLVVLEMLRPCASPMMITCGPGAMGIMGSWDVVVRMVVKFP